MSWVVITSEPEDGEMTVNESILRAHGPFETRELANSCANKIEADFDELYDEITPAIGVVELEAP